MRLYRLSQEFAETWKRRHEPGMYAKLDTIEAEMRETERLIESQK